MSNLTARNHSGYQSREVQKKDEKPSLREITKELKIKSDELSALYAIGQSIVANDFKLNDILDLISERVAYITKANKCLIHLVQEGKKRAVLKTHFGITPKILSKDEFIKFAGEIADSVIERKKILKIEDLWGHPRYKFLFHEEQEAWRSLLAVPLLDKGISIGAISVYNPKPSHYTKEDEKLVELFGSQCSIVIENAKLFEKTRKSYLDTIKLLAAIIDAKDSYTSQHSEKVMKSALAIAYEMKLSEKQKEIIKYASFLHDIGKIAVDVAILRKPGQLTQDEWGEIIRHSKLGADLIRRIGFLDDLVPTILHHHARYAGGGYPDPDKKGEDIPIESRILAVADSYEAMISDRPYRRALTKEQAIEELKKCAGTQFDPKIVGIFLKHLKKTKNNVA